MSSRLTEIENGLAIIGMSGRFPGAQNIEAFWDNLCQEIESITKFSDEELRAASIPESKIHDPNYVKSRGILKNVGDFDADFFGLSAKEAALTDPQHRLFLECCSEALEDAAYVPDHFSGSIGVYGGTRTDSSYYHAIFSNPQFQENSERTLLRIGNEHDFFTTRVSYKLNLKGPSLTIQTACSTSLVAICMACNQLLTRQCDIALAGGASISVPEESGYQYQEGMIFSPDGHCRPFDKKAQGTVPGNGVGVVTLKRLEDALKDQDHIYAIVRGFGVNNDGGDKIGYSAPSIQGQAKAISSAIKMAGIHSETITYIETHGTGTSLGDPIEIQALTEAFQEQTQNKGYCAIGSVKSNIGHLMETAGVAGLIKASLSLYHKKLPATLHFEHPNPHIHFHESPFYPNHTTKNWETDSSPRRALVSSLGFGGTNAHVILEEAPKRPVSNDIISPSLFILSAKTETALDKMTSRLSCYLENNPQLCLSDIAYTLQMGRSSFPYRKTFVASNLKELLSNLSKPIPSSKPVSSKPSIVFVFPDLPINGLHLNHMPYTAEPYFQHWIDLCATHAKKILGVDFRTLISSVGTQKIEIQKVVHFSLSYALKMLWEKWGVIGDNSIGLGIGEYISQSLSIEVAIEAIIQNPQPPSTITDYASMLKNLEQATHQVMIEMGPGNALRQHMDQEIEPYPDTFACSALPTSANEKTSTLSSIGKLWRKGLDINWKEIHGNAIRPRLSLPTYPFERKRFWIDPSSERHLEQPKTSSQDRIEETLLSIWKESLDNPSIAAEDDFFDLGGDSILAIQMVPKIQESLGIPLKLNTLMEYPSITKLSDIIKKQLSTPRKPIITLKKGDSRPPLFFLHQIDGHVFSYKKLASILSYPGTIYGIESCVAPDQPLSIEQMASKYIDALKHVQPTGFYHILGVSFGGLLAYEIAQQLHKDSETVVSLTMVDMINPTALTHMNESESDMFLSLTKLFSGKTISQESLSRISRKEQIHILMEHMNFQDLSSTEQEKTFETMHIHWKALKKYQPKPYVGKIHFFEAEDTVSSIEQNSLASTWANIGCHDMDSHVIPGSHLGIMTSPYVETLAKLLDDSFQNYKESPYEKI